MRATTPQQAIAGNRAAMIMMGIVPLALLVAIGWAIWTGGTHPFILALMSYLILVLVWMTVNLIDVNRVYHGQIAPGGGHHCVCAECGRMGSPIGPASPPTWMKSTPVELGLRWRPVMGALGLAPLLAFVHFLTVMLAPGDEGLRAAMSDPAGHVLRIALVVLPPIGIWLIFRYLKRLGERADALPPTHGCSCRWCGAPAQP